MKKSAQNWLYTVPGGKKWYVAALTLVQALLGGSGVLYALLLRGAVDAAVGRDGSGFLRYLIMVIALAAVQIALHAIVRWLTELSKSTFENVFKARLTETLLRKVSVQELAQEMDVDVSTIEEAIRLSGDRIDYIDASIE